jgi:hypothetical protein
VAHLILPLLSSLWHGIFEINYLFFTLRLPHFTPPDEYEVFKINFTIH